MNSDMAEREDRMANYKIKQTIFSDFIPDVRKQM